MNRTGILACVCTFAIAALLPGTARADAESTAGRCVAEIQNTVDRSASVVADRTAETIVLINRLLACGRVEAAIAAGRECVDQTRQDLRLASNHIDGVANDCIRKLVRMGEYQLARRVHNARNAAFRQLESFLERQKLALSDAFGN
ncbi:MAG: hypothetical protein OSA98_24230 [Rubripirellula sp.]|nr:hypothetical protein [Rubripirellula sp.]